MSFAVTAELVGASRKNYASCLKYATNCDFLPAPKKKKTLKALNFQGFLERKSYINRISPTVANARVRLQMDTPGCKSRGTVARHIFIARKKNCIEEYIVLNGSF